jgi:glycyl-tRNA synthetase beta chain
VVDLVSAAGVEYMRGSQIETESPKTDTERAIAERSQTKTGSRPKPQTLPFLLEVGCEEIPARFLRDAEKGLGERVLAALRESRLLPEGGAATGRNPPVDTFSTPRRLTVRAPKVLAQQPDQVEEIIGPPLKVSVDAYGNYTRAAESFAQKNSARLEDLARTTTPKGEYLSVRKTTPGRPSGEILSEVLPKAILGLSFPKSMYWRSKSDPRFVRPIRWVLAVLGEGKHAATVEFEILGVPSGDFTFGHRTKGQKALLVSGFKSYVKRLAQAHVELSHTKRRERVATEATAVLGDIAGKLVHDEWLIDWIANATEWPRPMLGSFDARFLHLPREILITVMRDHQRYFAVEDENGRLRPNFVAVLNMDSDEKGLIRQGHQRVLTARFRDAEFFWNADQKLPLCERLVLLDKVTYQEKLGSYGDKLMRMKAIAQKLCAELKLREAPSDLAPNSGPEQDAVRGVTISEAVSNHVLRAVELCKCDLTTQMVREFTELQGVVGGLYAKVQGEPQEVSGAIYDHYLPMGLEGTSPRTVVGALVSLADKLDSVVAGFAVGNEPTGSSDPFALRRQANGAIKVILEYMLPVDLKKSVETALDVLDNRTHGDAGAGTNLAPRVPNPGPASPDFRWRKSREEVRTSVLVFFAERLRFYFESVRGFRYDTVRAVLATGADQPAEAQARAEAMESLRGGEDFEALSAAAKRIRNILAKSATAADWSPGEVALDLLTEPQEKDLCEAYGRIAAEVEGRRARRDYRGALEQISTLRPAVDRFFDKVLVMAEDRQVRQNRLRLLKKLDELFSAIAHFAEIEG